MEYVREVPAECRYSGEAAGVWSGWSGHSDREVVREAAAKGTHIKLAHKCLAYRRRCTLAEAESYFAEELDIWIEEMLEKRQIHRASHILQNAGKNSLDFVRDRCVKCREPQLRGYLADYILANKGFEPKLEEAWNIIKSVSLLERMNGTEESLMGDCTIEEVSQLSDDVNFALIADLHFNTDESYFWEKMNAAVLWDYLLANNRIDRIVPWIDANFGDEPANVEEICSETRTFRDLAINDDMIESVAISEATYPVKEYVLGRLSRYGIFTRKERQDAKLVLARLFSNRITSKEFSSILSRSRCNIDRDEFSKELFTILHHPGVIASPVSGLNVSEAGKLLELMRELVVKPNVNTLKRAIVKNIEVYNSDLEAYLRNHSVLLLTLLILEHMAVSETQKARQFCDILKSDLKVESKIIGLKTIRQSLEKIPYLGTAFEECPRSGNPTIYDLLNGYEGLDVTRSFKWRERKEKLPNFRSENLVRKYGREEQLSYVHYLRESRPSMAVRALQRDNLRMKDHDKVNTRDKVDNKGRVDNKFDYKHEVIDKDDNDAEVIENVRVNEDVKGYKEVKVNEDVRDNKDAMVNEGVDQSMEVNEDIGENVTGNEELIVREDSKVTDTTSDEINEVNFDAEKEIDSEVNCGDSGVNRASGVRVNDTITVRGEANSKVKSRVRSDMKVEAKVEAAAYARALALELGDDEVTCACVAFVELLGLNSECLRVDATAWAYVEKHLGISIRDSLRSLGVSSSPKKGASLLRLLERSFVANLTQDNVDYKLGYTSFKSGLHVVPNVGLGDTRDENMREKNTQVAILGDVSRVTGELDLKSSQGDLFGRDNLDVKNTVNDNVEAIRELGKATKVPFNITEAVNFTDKVDEVVKVITNVSEVFEITDNLKDLRTINQKTETQINLKASLSDTGRFVNATRTWELIVRFARLHETPAPRLFLRLLALHDRRLEFVLAAQFFSYPLEAILESAHEFSNPHVREHLCLAMGNTRLLTKSEHEMRKCREVPEMLEIEEDEDLWRIVLRCHSSQDPPGAFLSASRISRSPILTVLAACYEPSATSGFCYSWLVVSVGTEKLLRDYETSLSEELWSAKSVCGLLRSCLDFGYSSTLTRAFLIFMPDHPLARLFKSYRVFLEDDADRREATLTLLRGFVEASSGLGSNPAIDWDNTTNDDYLWNSRWIAICAVDCTMSFLAHCVPSGRLVLEFLEIYAHSCFNEDLRVPTPNFSTLRRIVDILADTPVQFDFTSIRLLDDCKSNGDREIQRCVDRLLELEDFTNALLLSNTARLRSSSIIVAQYRSEFKRSTVGEGRKKLETSFWKRCAEDLRKYEVSFDETVAFFVEHAEKVSSHKERYEILKLVFESLKPIATDKKTLDTVEMAMWKSSILAGPDSIEIKADPGIFDKLKADLLSGISDLRVSCTLNDAAEESAVESLINRFITAGQLATALRINAIFNYKHRNLQILMLCLSLAEGEISPYQLTSQQRSLLTETGRINLQKYSTLRNRGLQKSSSVSPSNLSTNASDNGNRPSLSIQQIQLDTLSMIDRLVKSLQHGFAIGTRILLCAKLATYLRRSYQSVLTLEDPMQLLYDVVGSKCERKLQMVGDIVAAYRINNETVAKFLAQEIVTNTPRLVEESLEDSLVMWGNPLGNNIQAIIDLCNDPSILGWELLRTANLSLGNSHVLTLKVAVELLIRSHDCFTASCSMEGIASILRKAQHLAYTLQQRKQWSLLVRLLTGLGRFTEMNYVFQILKENDQFEFLLGKGLDKIPGLKTALLEFCKRQCPGDKELFTLIALHFTLYNEIAYMWESEAKELINELVTEASKNFPRNTTSGQALSLKITRNESVEKKLQVIIENFSHATEYYLQDNKLNLASRASYQAQLAALQISLLAAVSQNHQAPCLFNLNPDELNRAMCQDLTLPQALALAQAYNHRVEWSNVIYSHVIVNGETRYLKDFLARRSLTAAIVQDCVCRYRSEKTLTKQMTENMQMLVTELNDVECKYVLASQLGFKRIIEEMLANPSTGSYLKDTVWKQGFKTTDFYE